VVQGQVASDHGWLVILSRLVCSRGDKPGFEISEVGNTKWHSLSTRLSSSTSAGTFAVSAGPYRNYHAKLGTKNEPWHVFGTISRKGLENWSSNSNLRTRVFLFHGVQVHPWKTMGWPHLSKDGIIALWPSTNGLIPDFEYCQVVQLQLLRLLSTHVLVH